MGLNKSKGNMYEFITHTWNTVKGACEHDCSYCYMKRWGKLKPARFDEKELKTDLGKGNFIFVGSSNDLFANGISDEWIKKTLDYCNTFDNKYLFQTKNPQNVLRFIEHPTIKEKSVICTTLETNKIFPEIMGNTPPPHQRATDLGTIAHYGIKTYVTIEPIMDFDLDRFVFWLKGSNPTQINIGADTGGNKLPEPSKEKVLQLINEINKFTTIHNKSNLKRLLP
jgi:DNA repair photolyase